MPAVPTTVAQWSQGAQLFSGLGGFHRAITTASPQAQQYFDQGMRLLWAFNHDEATRSFAEAARLDPDCAACYWGVALTVGPNYNLPGLEAPRAQVAWEALQQAQQNAAHASAVEQALIGALSARYPSARAAHRGAGRVGGQELRAGDGSARRALPGGPGRPGAVRGE